VATVLVTGGAGYIGTHILTVLSAQGHNCICVDNYSNSSPNALGRVRDLGGNVEDYDVDIRDADALKPILSRHRIDSVIHLAGLKAVGESVQFPQRYYDNNVAGTRTLVDVLGGTRVRKLVFSSSATVYGATSRMPIAEDAPTAPSSPYGENKLEIEEMLKSLAARDPSWRVANLRYFNPVGAHPSGRIGEDPVGMPNNLMPFVCQVAAARLPVLQIFGSDYPTPDGTGVRDYIHVMDLAEGHVAALDTLDRVSPGTVLTANLGTGIGISVLALVEAFERVNGVRIPRKISRRREGDTAVCYADATLAREVFGWRAKRGIEEMCRDAWNWQKNNPMGYRQT
jgi:UDP-glucose 4-epimerase